MSNESLSLAKGWALAPLVLFITIFLGTGVYLHYQGVDYAFYQLPAPVAIIPAIIFALYLDQRLRQSTLDNSLTALISGMGNNKVITMCLIYLLAGAFSSVAKASGGVDAIVLLGLRV